MLFWLSVIIFVVGFALSQFSQRDFNYKKNKFLYCHGEQISMAGFIIALISGAIALILLIYIISAHVNVDARLEQYREEYDALVYKMESTTCRDEFGFLSKEVIDEVQEWNKSMRYYKSAQDNFWVGIFYPNAFDEFQTINYESYNKE